MQDQVVTGFETVALDPESGRSIVLLNGADPGRWDVPAGGSLGLFTTLLVIDAERYSNEVLSALAHRLLDGGLVYMCAWGPGCKRIHEVFDEEYVGDGELPEGRLVLGHFHPCVRWSESLAAPCYLVGDARLVLPAFSPDASGVNVLGSRRWCGHRCAVIAGDRVLDFGDPARLGVGSRTASPR